MARRIFTIFYIFMTIVIAIGGVMLYFTFPIWFFLWIGTGKWIYPPANALANNIMNWFMVRSSMKNFLSNDYYSREDYQTYKVSLKTQKFDS